jgi:hypothetical protein
MIWIKSTESAFICPCYARIIPPVNPRAEAPAEEHALGFGKILVAAADESVRGLAGEQAVGHRGKRLHVAQIQVQVRAGDFHRLKYLRVDASVSALSLIGRGDNDLAGPTIQLGRVRAHRRLAISLDLPEHFGDYGLACCCFRLRGFGHRLRYSTIIENRIAMECKRFQNSHSSIFLSNKSHQGSTMKALSLQLGVE